MIPQILSCTIFGVLVGVLLYTLNSRHRQLEQCSQYRRSEEPSPAPSTSSNNNVRRRNNKEFDSKMNRCTICQEDTIENGLITILKCGHIFHTDCQKKWARHGDLCPNCMKTMQVHKYIY